MARRVTFGPVLLNNILSNNLKSLYCYKYVQQDMFQNHLFLWFWFTFVFPAPFLFHLSTVDVSRCCQKLAQLAQLPTGPWAVDIYDEDQSIRFRTWLAWDIRKSKASDGPYGAEEPPEIRMSSTTPWLDLLWSILRLELSTTRHQTAESFWIFGWSCSHSSPMTPCSWATCDTRYHQGCQLKQLKNRKKTFLCSWKVRTWLFKIDDERSSRGTAYIDLLKMQQVLCCSVLLPISSYTFCTMVLQIWYR